uniref:Uncharacterized protein n=1 Tax=Anguilla anguilla TaxID=7936 RepID=A0A0E9PHP5_ANGAN
MRLCILTARKTACYSFVLLRNVQIQTAPVHKRISLAFKDKYTRFEKISLNGSKYKKAKLMT